MAIESLEEAWATQTPGHFAALASRGKWKIAPHLELLNHKLVGVATKRSRRLLITMPPRHGKSELASRYFPAWYLCLWPFRRVILASYGAKFASQWGRKVRDLIEDIGGSLFGVTLREDTRSADEWEIAGYAGGMQTCGVGGPLTGKGADLLIIDDPIKNAEEANSDVYRDKTWDWYTSTAYTRLEPGGSVVLIQTRWHEDDLAGRILERAKESQERWEVVNLPALAGESDPLDRSPGEPLWPERYGAIELDQIRRTLGSYQFSALYGQSPTPDEGGLFRRSWFRYWSPTPGYYLLGPDRRSVRIEDCRRFLTVDLAFSLKKEADYTVISAWAVTPQQDLIWLDMHRERMEAHVLNPSIRAMSERHGADYVGIEKVLGQSLIVHGARMDGMTVRSLVADTDKITRSIPAQVRMENGQVYFPSRHPDLDAIEHELLTFPRGTHDDIVDTLSYAAADVQRFGAPYRPEAVAVEVKDEEEDEERWWR